MGFGFERQALLGSIQPGNPGLWLTFSRTAMKAENSAIHRVLAVLLDTGELPGVKAELSEDRKS